MSIFYDILTGIIVFFIVVGLIEFITKSILRRNKKGAKEKNWYLQLFLSKEDAVS
ncbi:MAG: hypothetical protein KatS3mg095_0807 [Candidatus Parcubacteria bacterium]|nr:MAG: hypothetical protein KatS3mg095_0807 [Candidatus Parcubacteria bacterium]